MFVKILCVSVVTTLLTKSSKDPILIALHLLEINDRTNPLDVFDILLSISSIKSNVPFISTIVPFVKASFYSLLDN